MNLLGAELLDDQFAATYQIPLFICNAEEINTAAISANIKAE
jgi:hypothetical protein